MVFTDLLFSPVSLEDIAKVKYLWPNAYEIKQERHIPGVAMYNSYQLTIIIKDDKLTANKLILRRRKFRSRLLKVVRDHHNSRPYPFYCANFLII